MFLAKTPATRSVEAGHYFQGKQGTMFLNRLSEFNILKVPFGDYADNHLLTYNYGITDIVKVPRGNGNEPAAEVNRILSIIEEFNPKVLIFVYKKVLNEIINLSFWYNS